ncbi:hypothetical protein BKA70DRAFT_1034354, partial [Coprinopsis sp. MPI-PUGE-AT-0042]
RLAGVLAACSGDGSKPLVLTGDLNARTGGLQSNPATSRNIYPRTSQDSMVSTRGRWLLNLISSLDLVIVNGTIHELGSAGAYTSFQPNGSSVIDYFIVSDSLLVDNAIDSLNVHCPRLSDDHAIITLDLLLPSPNSNTNN